MSVVALLGLAALFVVILLAVTALFLPDDELRTLGASVLVICLTVFACVGLMARCSERQSYYYNICRAGAVEADSAQLCKEPQ